VMASCGGTRDPLIRRADGNPDAFRGETYHGVVENPFGNVARTIPREQYDEVDRAKCISKDVHLTDDFKRLEVETNQHRNRVQNLVDALNREHELLCGRNESKCKIDLDTLDNQARYDLQHIEKQVDLKAAPVENELKNQLKTLKVRHEAERKAVEGAIIDAQKSHEEVHKEVQCKVDQARVRHQKALETAKTDLKLSYDRKKKDFHATVQRMIDQEEDDLKKKHEVNKKNFANEVKGLTKDVEQRLASDCSKTVENRLHDVLSDVTGFNLDNTEDTWARDKADRDASVRSLLGNKW